MLRIMEAIQRKKLIQLLNDEYKQDMEHDEHENTDTIINYTTPPKVFGKHNTIDYDDIPYITPSLTVEKDKFEKNNVNEDIKRFIQFLESRLTDLQKKALRITWKKMSEAPRTSSIGMLCIMEKVFEKLLSENSEISNVFYRSAFLSCIEDRKNSKLLKNDKEKCLFKKKTIATLRDHANILLDFVNTIITQIYGIPYKPRRTYELTPLGCSHGKLIPLGFDRNWFHKLGECFAEVMFSQECIRAFPHAPSAWSLFAVSFTEKLYSECKLKKNNNCPEIQRPIPNSCSFSEWSHKKLSQNNKINFPNSSKSMHQIKYVEENEEDENNEINTGRPTNL
ncbi:Globin-like domain and Globin, structural domain-containing protein [Strongyloides ratti]|uniref:Globin-like domain and Globin, structural domain-containing protein n=1 Tax=Strongyloides ratti TaxID=34506 RepID=A0A090LML9_STRRB|nr:Globin-like domain and Globin, structural domain-containing protein [Strongyloides ratti]CEF69413.1 Globin-like domain and Globin, structural domain-containing protein [Strongyloides ratti]